jgi:UDPglucose 6-dehydrogenase
MKIAVVGLWHLGTITSLCMSSLNHTIYGFDKNEIIKNFTKLKPPINEFGVDDLLKKNINKKIFFQNNFKKLKGFNIIWITYDTIINNYDKSNVANILSKIKKILLYVKKNSIIIISSQIPVGTIKKIESYDKKKIKKNLKFVYIPENLRLGSSIKNFLYPDRLVIGCRNSYKTKKIIEKIFIKIKAKKFFVDPETAEMSKHIINSFLACSISFINEIGLIAKNYRIPFRDLKNCVQSDNRIGYNSYLNPGNAFSGGTLARDVNFLLMEAKKKDSNSILIRSILASNKIHSKWVENLLNKKFKSKKNILQIGISYTSGTSTLRRSLPYEIFKKISKKHFVRVYDNFIYKNLNIRSSLRNFFLEKTSVHKFSVILIFNKITKLSFLKSIIRKNATVIDVNGQNKKNILLSKYNYISPEYD